MYCKRVLKFLRTSHFTYFIQADKYQMLDQLLNDESFHETHRLCSCVKSKQLENVADVKGTVTSLMNFSCYKKTTNVYIEREKYFMRITT